MAYNVMSVHVSHGRMVCTDFE